MNDLSKQIEHGGSTLSGILLVAGTSIGAGMLALPVVTGEAGFLPSLFISFLCWLYMMLTGLLFLEATLWMPDGANLLSMAKRFTGRKGEVVSGLFFIFLYYCLMISYVSKGAQLLFSSTESFWIYWIFAAFFGGIVAVGSRVIDRVNGILMMGMLISYCMLLATGSQQVQLEYLVRSYWPITIFAAPTLFSAYGYHNIIPSIASYLNRNVKNLRKAIVGGTFLTFCIYAFWLWVAIGSLSKEALVHGVQEQLSASELLQQETGSSFLGQASLFFGFFAIVTSVLGVGFSMVDFFGDGLNVTRKGSVRIGLSALVFIPPALIAGFYKDIFLSALGIAGGFGEAFLNGLLPVWMVYVGRYRMGLSQQNSWGGKSLLWLLGVIAILIMGVEVYLLMKN